MVHWLSEKHFPEFRLVNHLEFIYADIVHSHNIINLCFSRQNVDMQKSIGSMGMGIFNTLHESLIFMGSISIGI